MDIGLRIELDEELAIVLRDSHRNDIPKIIRFLLCELGLFAPIDLATQISKAECNNNKVFELFWIGFEGNSMHGLYKSVKSLRLPELEKCSVSRAIPVGSIRPPPQSIIHPLASHDSHVFVSNRAHTVETENIQESSISPLSSAASRVSTSLSGEGYAVSGDIPNASVSGSNGSPPGASVTPELPRSSSSLRVPFYTPSTSAVAKISSDAITATGSSSLSTAHQPSVSTDRPHVTTTQAPGQNVWGLQRTSARRRGPSLRRCTKTHGLSNTYMRFCGREKSCRFVKRKQRSAQTPFG
ncbi:hypothetical protein BV25DRAFT_1835378 [Artomyces pyxidatus]|uniref:Uncharacterized protein n=1 Tax=Artomyces pyxidatus TaxID=48021 RepID=A0ACB8TF33_9AGAM|nr:hypothetical protein BV25DRAFT_1835378 [Artomyces pyxidatus]